MLTNHYNTLSKPISPKSVCCVSQTSVSLYRSAEERSYLSLAEARLKRGLLLLIWCKGTKNRTGSAMPLEERSGRKGTTSNSHVEIGAVGGGVRADVLYIMSSSMPRLLLMCSF